MNPDGSVDTSSLALFDRDSGRVIELGVLRADGATEALKITSKAKDILVRGQEIHGGKEDCLDLNNECEGIRVHFDSWFANGEYLVTCKGGCQNIELSGCIMRHGRTTDIDLDNASDQSKKPTSNIRLNFKTLDGSAVRVRCLGPNKPIILNPEQRYDIKDAATAGALFKLLRSILAIFGIRI
jgi:hypothetical protein